MAYRNGTYVAFHADGNNIPGGKSDIDYYNLIKAWDTNKSIEFSIVNSHEKANAVRDSSKFETLRNSLLERMRNSKNLLLVIGETTRFDTDWVPFEISKAVDFYKIPVIAAYTMCQGPIRRPTALEGYWPPALATRITNQTARVIHVPFKQNPIHDAISKFGHDAPPGGPLTIYTDSAYIRFGVTG